MIIKWVALTLPVLEEVISPSRYQHFRLMSLLNCSLVKRAMCSLVSLRDLASLCQCWSPPYSCRLVNVSAFEDSFSIRLCVKVPFRCWLFPWRLSPSSSRWNATGSASRHCLEARYIWQLTSDLLKCFSMSCLPPYCLCCSIVAIIQTGWSQWSGQRAQKEATHSDRLGGILVINRGTRVNQHIPNKGSARQA